MKLADQISKTLAGWCNSGSDIVIPNYYVGMFECDLLRVTKAGMFYEYEVKISRSDFFNDFKKQYETRDTTDWDIQATSYRDLPLITTNKHQETKAGRRANKFYFVVPEGLIKKEECPEYAGLIYYKVIGSYKELKIVKTAKLLRKEKALIDMYGLAVKLCARENGWRQRINFYAADIKRVKEFEKQIEKLLYDNVELNNEIYELKHPELANDRLWQMSKKKRQSKRPK